MVNELFNFTFISECFAFLVAICLLDRKTGIWRLFIPYLFLTILAEYIGWWISYKTKSRNNAWVYDVLLIINGAFALVIIAGADSVRQAKKYLFSGACVFIVFGIVNMLLFEGLRIYNIYTEILQDILAIVFVCYFFLQLLAEEHYRNLFTYEYFWMATGFLFSSFGSIVLYVFIDSLDEYSKNTHINIYGYINYGLNIVFYLSLIISFACRRKNTRSLPVS